MKELALRSCAKLNLFLLVLNKRKDNYHNIVTLLEKIDLSDRIILQSRPKDKKIKIVCSHPDVPKDNSNLAYRSAELLQDSCNINTGVNIKIIKRIPVGSGLGGGSSNAASVLSGLNKLWRLKLSQKKLLNYAARLGCDVPFFIYHSRFALGLSRGDRIKPLKQLDNVRLWHILIAPKLKVSTPVIYQKWDRESGLTKPRYNVKILTSALRKNNPTLLNKAMFNSLEEITTKLHPQVEQIKESLRQEGIKSILMSGSGPAVFGLVASRREAEILSKQLKEKYEPWQVFVTTGGR